MLKRWYFYKSVYRPVVDDEFQRISRTLFYRSDGLFSDEAMLLVEAMGEKFPDSPNSSEFTRFGFQEEGDIWSWYQEQQEDWDRLQERLGGSPDSDGIVQLYEEAKRIDGELQTTRYQRFQELYPPITLRLPEVLRCYGLQDRRVEAPNDLREFHILTRACVIFVVWFSKGWHLQLLKEQRRLDATYEFITDLYSMAVAVDKAWKMMPRFWKQLTIVAGDSISACGEQANNAHEAALQLTNRVGLEMTRTGSLPISGTTPRGWLGHPSDPPDKSQMDETIIAHIEQGFKASCRRAIDACKTITETDLTNLTTLLEREFILATTGKAKGPATPEKPLPEEQDSATPGKVPPEERTRPMSFREAAKLMGKGDSQDAAEWLSACAKDGSIRWEKITRQKHVFSIHNFPKVVWPRILPPPDNSKPS